MNRLDLDPVTITRGIGDEIAQQTPERLRPDADHGIPFHHKRGEMPVRSASVRKSSSSARISVAAALFRRLTPGEGEDNPPASGSSRPHRASCLRPRAPVAAGPATAGTGEDGAQVMLTPFSMVVRCSMAPRCGLHLEKGKAGAPHLARPTWPNCMSRPLPKLSAASARLRIGRIWLRNSKWPP